MKRFSEQLNKKAMTVKLRAAEKRDLRERVVSYMEYHPLPTEMKKPQAIKEPKLLTEEYKSVAIPFKLLGRWAAGVAMVVIVTVPFMAERSVPGDGLYAVKRFNEDIRGTLSFNTIQKVEWETELLNRRISEARLLASEGKLTDEVEAEVAEAVRNHSENAQKNIEVLRTEDEDEATMASLALETTLAVQSVALSDDSETVMPETGEPTSSETAPSVLVAAIEESLEQTNATNEASTIPAFDKLMAKVEVNTTRVYELRDSLEPTIPADHVSEITRRIQDIERSVAEALTARAESEEDDEVAREMLVDSLQSTQKLIVFMTDIEVSLAVDIEEIVPVVLTPAEENKILTDYETEFNEKLATIKKAQPFLDDESLIEKIEVVLVEIETIMIGFSTEADFDASETQIGFALELVRNLFTLLELEAVGETEEPELPIDTGTTTEEVASSTETVVEEEDEESEMQESETNGEEPDEEIEEVFEEEVEIEIPTEAETDLSTEQVDEG